MSSWCRQNVPIEAQWTLPMAKMIENERNMLNLDSNFAEQLQFCGATKSIQLIHNFVLDIMQQHLHLFPPVW